MWGEYQSQSKSKRGDQSKRRGSEQEQEQEQEERRGEKEGKHAKKIARTHTHEHWRSKPNHTYAETEFLRLWYCSVKGDRINLGRDGVAGDGWN